MSQQTLHVLPPAPPARPDTNPGRLNARLALWVRWLLNALSFVAGDLLALSLSFYGAGSVRHWLKGGDMLPQWSFYVAGCWVVTSLGLKLSPGWGLGVVDATRRLFLLLVTIFAGTTSALFLVKMSDNTSRLTLSLAFLLSLLLIPILRTLVKKILIRANLWGMQVVIYGMREKTEDLIQVLTEGAGMGYQPVGVFLADCRPGDVEVKGVPVLGEREDPYPFAHTAIILEPSTLKDHHPDFAEQATLQYRKVLIVPELREHAPSLWVTPRDLGGVLGMEISMSLLDPVARMVKLASEFVIVLLILPFAIPLIAVLSLLVWIGDFHSPFFIQNRLGKDGKLFRMWKFRTMRPDAEAVLQEKLEQDTDFRIEWERGFKSSKDPRITGVGQFLRRTSLDELPQFLNILKGEMALIGPRPLPAYHENELPEHVRVLRRRVRPGMTGLWQVSGRSESGNEGFIRWDSYYVRNWSIWLDIVILVRTFQAILRRTGAY
jgi:Undecaprenyl-phosphate galactose phosphotransferase WbaP